DRVFRFDQAASGSSVHAARPPAAELAPEPPEPHGASGRRDDGQPEDRGENHRAHQHGPKQHGSEGHDRQHLDERISRAGEGIEAIAHVHVSIVAHCRLEGSCPPIRRNTPSNRTTHPCATRSNCSIRWRTRPSASGVHVARNATTCSGSTYSSVPSMRISPASVSPPASSTTVPPEPVQTWRHCPLLGTKKLKLVPVDPLIQIGRAHV